MLFTFGANEDGQCARVQAKSPASSLVSSPLALGSPMKKYNSNSQEESNPSPYNVIFPDRIVIKYVSAGSRHSIALSTCGEIYAWGWGVQGQLGLGDFRSVYQPTKIEFETRTPLTFISAGGMHSGCIDSQGYCYTWGSAQYGQLGQGNSVISKKKTCVPDRVTLDNGDPLIATWLSCGGMHTAAIDTDGDVWCWGRSDSGQTGCNKWIQTFVPFVSHPEKLPPFESAAVSVRCGGFHTMVVTKDGRVYSMGKEDFGMLGINCISDSSEVTVDGYSYNPRLVAALEGHHVVGVSCGGWHSLFWTKNGDLFACGKGEYGRLGLLNEESVTTPQLVKLDDGIKIHTASAGGSHSLIVDTKGVLYVVGRADDGRLGLETLSPNDHRVLQVQPLHIDGGRKVLCVAAGGSHSLVVTNVDEHFSQEISSEIVDMR